MKRRAKPAVRRRVTPCWRFETREPIRHFLPAVSRILTGYNTVCLEHANTRLEAVELYERFRSNKRFNPQRDTSYPRTRLFYCHIGPEFIDGLLQLSAKYQIREFLWHMRGYDEQRLIFYSHDACDGADVVVSPQLPEELIKQLARESGCQAVPDEICIDWDEVQTR